MAIKTTEQYLQSLRDGREVWFEGERVQDVTKHHHLRTAVESCAMDYELAQNPKYKKLLIEHDKDGEPYHAAFKAIESTEDLFRRREFVQLTARIGFGNAGGAKFTGIDALHSITALGRKVDKELGTSYAPRVEAFRDSCQKNDAAIAVAMMDVKGDRSLRPSQQKTHKDYYLRIVDEKKDGIIVRGAKIHISYCPVANEVIVLPCRVMKEDDKAYAVSFAFSPNTKGVTMITAAPEVIHEEDELEYPLGSHINTAEALVIFDDVFIPMERVFLKGEWQFAADATYMFTNFHRASADAYKYTENEIMVGAAALMAEYNGIEKAAHIQDKLAWLTYYAETTEALGRVACKDSVKDPYSGLVYPNPMYSNAAKFFFADNFHQAIKTLIDITGGIAVTAPSSKDYLNPKLKPLMDKYLGGKDGIPAEHRFRAIKLAKDLVSPWIQTTTLHAEGSMAAQRLSFNSLGDWDKYKAAARRVAGIPGGKPHPIFDALPKFPMWTWRKK